MTPIGSFVIEQIDPQWDTQDTWTGSVQDYSHITCDGYNYVDGTNQVYSGDFWRGLEKPSWYTDILAGRWTGRIHLGGVAARDGRPGGTFPFSDVPTIGELATPVREFMNPMAEFFGQRITEGVEVDESSPYNGGLPASDHPILEGVEIVGRDNQSVGTAVISGDGESLTEINGESVARIRAHQFPSNRVSILVTGDWFNTFGDSGSGDPPPPRWRESSRQLARNFWNVPI